MAGDVTRTSCCTAGSWRAAPTSWPSNWARRRLEQQRPTCRPLVPGKVGQLGIKWGGDHLLGYVLGFLWIVTGPIFWSDGFGLWPDFCWQISELQQCCKFISSGLVSGPLYEVGILFPLLGVAYFCIAFSPKEGIPQHAGEHCWE